MQRLFLLPAVLALALIPATSLALDDIKIFPTRIYLDTSTAREQGAVNVASKDIAYTVKVTNSSSKEITGVTVKYNIFYEVAEIGRKGDPEVKLSSGSHTIPNLLSNRPVDFETSPIKLSKAALDSGWYFGNGAPRRAQDKVVGLWFKAFDSTGKQVGEYLNPSTVPQKRKWKD